MSFKTKTIIVKGLGAMSLLSWFSYLYIYYYHFQNGAPTTPNTVTGQVYAVNSKGHIFYVTKQQEITGWILICLPLIAFLLGGVLDRRWKVYETIYGKWSRRSW